MVVLARVSTCWTMAIYSGLLYRARGVEDPDVGDKGVMLEPRVRKARILAEKLFFLFVMRTLEVLAREGAAEPAVSLAVVVVADALPGLPYDCDLVYGRAVTLVAGEVGALLRWFGWYSGVYWTWLLLEPGSSSSSCIDS